MFRNHIIPSLKQDITDRLENLPQGVMLILNMDMFLQNTFLKGTDLSLADQKLMQILKLLKETNHTILLLTKANSEHLNSLSEQLESFDIFGLTMRHIDAQLNQSKATVIASCLNELHPDTLESINSVWIFDDNRKDLNQIANHLQSGQYFKRLTLKLQFYQPTTQIFLTESTNFPYDLKELVLDNIKPLGGGTKSTFLFFNKSGQPFVLKFGAHQNHIKVEILMNKMYQALGVPVPRLQAYHHIPKLIAKRLQLSQYNCVTQLSEYIEEQDYIEEKDTKDIIIKQAQKDFVIHAFLGNIDIAKFDNFIVNSRGIPILLDSGANVVFRSLGEERNVPQSVISELDSLRDKNTNPKSFVWFESLSQDQIVQQIESLVAKRGLIEKTVWEVSEQLYIPVQLRNHILNLTANRFDALTNHHLINFNQSYSMNNFQYQDSVLRPMLNTQDIKKDIYHTQLKKAWLLSEFKQRFFQSSIQQSSLENKESVNKLSQSELHLQYIMGQSYRNEVDIDQNIAAFIRSNYLDLGEHQQDRLIEQTSMFIEYEKQSPNQVFFYHGVNADIDFAYSLYTALYQHLNFNPWHNALRVDNPIFHKCLNIEQFIEYFQTVSEDKTLHNYSDGYMQIAISTNLFLFGNHLNKSSHSLTYYTNNWTKADIDIKAMLESCLKNMGITQTTIDMAVELAKQRPNQNSGVLYQVSIPKDLADKYAYPSASLGKLNPLTINGKQYKTITEILAAIEKGEAPKLYVKKLQARLMVPPNATFNIRKKYFEPDQSSLGDKARFIQELKKISNNMVYDLLTSHSPFNKLNTKMPLVKQVSQVLRSMGIHQDSKLSDDLIVNLVTIGDFTTLKSFIRFFPDIKDKPLIVFDRAYLKNHHRIAKTTSLLTLLLEKKQSGEIVRELYGDSFYKNRVEELGVINVLKAIHPDQKIDFIDTHHYLINTIKTLVSLLNNVSEDTRTLLAKRYINLIRDIDDLCDILIVLPIKERLDFLKSISIPFADEFDLASILTFLESDERLSFAQNNKDLIKRPVALCLVLARLNKTERLKFAQENASIIKNGHGLSLVLSKLAEKDRMMFATTHQDKIDDANELAKVLVLLSTKESLVFAMQHKNKIRNSYILKDVLKLLPEETRFAFAICFLEITMSKSALNEIIACLPSQDQIRLQQKVEDSHFKIDTPLL